MRITVKPTVKNCAIHKQTDIQRQKEAQLLLGHRFDVTHANNPGKGEEYAPDKRRPVTDAG
ncbi:Hypothetical protein AKI40_0190 [Enterobacter sp. FY-07]|nr:Hypothetical protein AKI40_0190 [Enterobacter sp. FY-07]